MERWFTIRKESVALRSGGRPRFSLGASSYCLLDTLCLTGKGRTFFACYPGPWDGSILWHAVVESICLGNVFMSWWRIAPSDFFLGAPVVAIPLGIYFDVQLPLAVRTHQPRAAPMRAMRSPRFFPAFIVCFGSTKRENCIPVVRNVFSTCWRWSSKSESG